MAILAQAPVAFSNYTTLTGTAEQITQVSAAGLAAGVNNAVASNFYLDSPSANLLPGRSKVTATGWIKAHGATQTVKIALMWQAWSGASRISIPLDTFTVVASPTLLAGVFYDFNLEQTFYTEPNSGLLFAVLPSLSINGNAVSIVTGAPSGPLPLPNLSSASQTSPVTGINTSYNYPAVSFCIGLVNSVSDTAETFALTSFTLEQA